MTKTPQAVFNKVARHLLKQGERSVNTRGECMYRGRNGLKCAVGCLIPDNKYRKDLEGAAALEPKVLKACGLPDSMSMLLSQLQTVHDYREVSTWPTELRQVAEDYGLSAEVLGDAR